jgi:hypothetical protein
VVISGGAKSLVNASARVNVQVKDATEISNGIMISVRAFARTSASVLITRNSGE